MKKTLLSIVALVAMVVVVAACNGNAKVVEAQVKALESISAKLDSVQTMEQFQALGQELQSATEAFAAKAGELKLTPEEAQKITDASAAFAAKAQPVAQRLAEEAAKKVAEEAAKAEKK